MSLDITKFEKFIPYFLIAVLFFIPISASLKSIFIILSAVGLLLTPAYRNQLPFVFSEHWCKSALALFLVVIFACYWSAANYHTRFMFIDKYSKLLYLPIFAIGFQQQSIRRLGIYVFLFSMVITCIMSFILDTGDPTTPGRVFHDHVTTGYMMAFATYLSAWLMIRAQGRRAILLMLLTLLFSYQLIFVNTGRIGYLLYFVLMLLFLIQTLPWKYVGVGIICFCTLFSLCAYNSHALSSRVHKAFADLNHYQQGDKVTPVGIRLVFHAYAKTLFLSKPWKGHGTGSFSHFYQQYNTAPEYSKIMEPHSQYWLIASEYGLLGLVALFYFFSSLIVAAFRLEEMKPIMLAMLVCFFTSNLLDSQLLHSNVGYLFIIFCALCLGEALEQRIQRSPVRLQPNIIPLKTTTA